MKFLLLTCALIGCTLAAQLPDSATQGPNPQDIATPEPEYIDIDEPLPAPAQAPAPAPLALQSRSSFVAAPQPLQRPVAQPQFNYLAPQLLLQSQSAQSAYAVPAHSFNSQSGYQYRRPVYYRRVYRRFY